MHNFLLLMIFLFLHSGDAYGELNKVNYFAKISQNEKSLTLQDLGLSSCKEFTDKYFAIAKDDPETHMKAIAYDIGFCVKQDLRKARDLYEQSQKYSSNPINYPIRLALIYQFGPKPLQDYNRARFLARQTAIYLAPAKPGTRLTIIQNTLAGPPVPSLFKQELDWIENILQQSDIKKRQIAKTLSKQGFQETSLIWNRAKNLKPIQREKLR